MVNRGREFERGTMVTFLDGLMRMNSHDHLIT